MQTSFAGNLQIILLSLSLSLSQVHPPIGVATPRAEGRAGRLCRSGVRRPFRGAAVGPAWSLTPGVAGLPLPMPSPQKGPPPALLAPQKVFFLLTQLLARVFGAGVARRQLQCECRDAMILHTRARALVRSPSLYLPPAFSYERSLSLLPFLLFGRSPGC